MICDELERHAAALGAFLGEEVSSADLLPSFKSVSPKAGSAVILSPFGSRPIRDFPLNHLLAALHEINARLPDAAIRLTGGPGDFARLALLFRTLSASGVENLEQRKRPSSLLDFIRAIADARLVLTVETSTAHIASALDKPTVVLLGGGHFGQFAPWNKSARQVWVYKPLPCYRCDWDCIFTETRCITEIPPSSVSSAVATVLSREDRRERVHAENYAQANTFKEDVNGKGTNRRKEGGSGKDVCVIIPAHNRKRTTIRCLERLEKGEVFQWATVLVIDDGSTDGTAEAVHCRFPHIVVREGNGTLWWAGAITEGMRVGMKRGAECFIWLNDDCLPAPDTLPELVGLAKRVSGIAAAQAVTPSGGIYGGFRRTLLGLAPSRPDAKAAAIRCDTVAGNCVCIHRSVVEKIGLPDSRHFPHSLADADYGLRASKAGLPVILLNKHFCENEDNFSLQHQSWLLSDISLRRLWQSVFTVKSNVYPPARFHLFWRHWGILGIAIFTIPYLRFSLISMIRLMVPRSLLRRAYGSRSAVWRARTKAAKGDQSHSEE